MSAQPSSLADLVAEGAEFIVNEHGGGTRVRYVRVYCSTFYRFEDVTERVQAALALPTMRGFGGLHTVAIEVTDAELATRIVAAVGPPSKRAPVASPSVETSPPPPAGGKRVRSKSPSPTRPPRGGAVATAERESKS
jgi:hypothetical protein